MIRIIKQKKMIDVFIEGIYKKMKRNKRIFFVSADFGAPSLDNLRKDFKDRFFNVGIAEQNLINVSSGLSKENNVVYAYAIAPFLTMRGYEQIRQNLAISAQIKQMNLNLIGVGAGLSYDIAGPSHHCLEDISIMRLLPNLMIFSPSDYKLTEYFIDYSIKIKMPKYLRFDSKPLALIYTKDKKPSFKKGFYELVKGKKVCFVATGRLVHTVLAVAQKMKNVGVIDVFILKPMKEKLLSSILKKYEYIISVEEGFINCGGLDALIQKVIRENNLKVKFKNLGFKDKYIFNLGSREYLHKLNKIDEDSLLRIIQKII